MLRILLIDDEIMERRLLQGMLREYYEANFVLEYAPTIEEGISLLQHNVFDVVLLDDKLSDGTTSKINVPALKKFSGKLPLIIISKSIDSAYLKDKSILNVYDVIDKFNLRDRINNGLLN